jgi:hypothetical protein
LIEVDGYLVAVAVDIDQRAVVSPTLAALGHRRCCGRSDHCEHHERDDDNPF